MVFIPLKYHNIIIISESHGIFGAVQSKISAYLLNMFIQRGDKPFIIILVHKLSTDNTT